MKYLNLYEQIDFNDDDFDEEEFDPNENFIFYEWVGEYSLCYLIEKNYSGKSNMSVWDVDKRNSRMNCYDEYRNNYEQATTEQIKTYLDEDKMKKLLEF